MNFDVAFLNELQCDSYKLSILDSENFSYGETEIEYVDGDLVTQSFVEGGTFELKRKEILGAYVQFHDENAAGANCAVVSVEYLKDGAVVGSSLVQFGSCELKLLKYKVVLPRGAKVTLFDDATMEAKYLAWNIPCPTSFPNLTFLQVKAANGFEQQLTPSPGSQTIELYTELGRRYAVFGEIWTYSFAQTLWFAALRVQLSDDTWKDVVPTAGEGGTIVTALPQ